MLAPAGSAEVLAKGARLRQQWMRAQLGELGSVMLSWVVMNGFLHAAMHAQIPLFVADQTQRGHRQLAVVQLFVYGTVRARLGEGLCLPGKQRVEGNAGPGYGTTLRA